MKLNLLRPGKSKSFICPLSGSIWFIKNMKKRYQKRPGIGEHFGLWFLHVPTFLIVHSSRMLQSSWKCTQHCFSNKNGISARTNRALFLDILPWHILTSLISWRRKNAMPNTKKHQSWTPPQNSPPKGAVPSCYSAGCSSWNGISKKTLSGCPFNCFPSSVRNASKPIVFHMCSYIWDEQGRVWMVVTGGFEIWGLLDSQPY